MTKKKNPSSGRKLRKVAHRNPIKNPHSAQKNKPNQDTPQSVLDTLFYTVYLYILMNMCKA